MGMRFLTWLFVFTLAGLSAVAGLNALIDPTSYLTNARLVTPVICSPGIRADEERSKQVAVVSFAPDALLVGTSQVALGFDASDPILRLKLGRTYNLGIDGLGTTKMDALLRDIIPALNVRTVIVGVTFGMTLDRRLPEPRIGEPGSARLRGVWTFKEALLTKHALFASIRALFSHSQCVNQLHQLNGTRVFDDPRPPHVRFRSEEINYIIYMRRILSPTYNYRNNLTDLYRLAAFLCAQKIMVYVVVLPNHARRLEVWRNIASDDRMDQWKRDMTQLAAQQLGTGCAIELWDFGYHNSVTTLDPDSPGIDHDSFPYWESSHFDFSVGHRVLQRIFLGAQNDFGVKLTPETIEAHIRRASAERDAWRLSHPDAVTEVARLMSETAW